MTMSQEGFAGGPEHLLLFGASGAIGRSILQYATERGWRVTAVSRQVPQSIEPADRWLGLDPLASDFGPELLQAPVVYSSVCWAQGANATDSVYDVSVSAHLATYNANCTYILATLQALLAGGLLAKGSRMCVISSIWQNMARQTKLSYCMSKAALQGLVLSASVDLAADGHLINAVLPAALDTPMTQQNLSAE